MYIDRILMMPFTWINTISVTEIGAPALIYFTLAANQSYTIENSNTDRSYSLSNDSSSSRTYSGTSYYSNGNQNWSRDNTYGSFSVQSGGRITLTIGSYDIVTYFPYTFYQPPVTIADSAGRILEKPTYPDINLAVPYTANSTEGGGLLEYIYDAPDPGETVVLPTEQLTNVKDSSSATSAVNVLTASMTSEQKQSATGADLAALFAETAAAKAASKTVTGKEIIINKANVTPLAEKAGSAVDAVDAALVSGGITTARYLSNTVILTSTETGEIAIKIDPDILETEVDKVRVETPNYALTLKISDLEEDLTGVITIKSSTVTASASGGGAAMAHVFMKASVPRTSSSKTTAVKLDVPNGKLKGPVTISFPDHDGDADGNETIVDADNNAKSSKYNPATSTMDGKVTESGTYTTTTNRKDFTDIGNKSKEMQQAIRYLASKGIINGTSETTFSPDGAISRAEVAALLVRALGKLDTSAKSTFADVKTSDWYYATAASSAKCGLIKGYEDNTFHGNNNILKQETVTVVSRVLQTEMGYKVPSNTAIYLTRYSDTIPNWVKQHLALATRENLIVYRVDGTFSGSKTITRGDAAIVLYRLFQKIW